MPAWCLTAISSPRPRLRLASRLASAVVPLLWLLGSLAAQAQTGLPTVNQADQRPVPLPLAQAFPFYISQPDSNQWQITWNPAPGHYLYRHAFAFSLQTRPDSETRPLDFSIPPGLAKSDQFFGDIEAYYGQVTATLQLGELPAGSQLWIEYQGCADWGFCYPPQRTAFSPP